jgi:hypothetical protein
VRAFCLAHARSVVVRAFKQAQGLEEVEAGGRGLEFRL